MAEKLAKWSSKRGLISKIRPSDDCKGDTVPLAVGPWYNFHSVGCHLGNVGYRSLTTRLLGLGAAAALALAAATAPLAAGSLVSTGDQVLANGSHPGQSGPNGPGNGGKGGGSADGSGNGNPGKSGPGNS